MERENHSSLAEQLLQVPATFAREHYRAFLYEPYSRKLHRRIYCYGHDRYDMWVLMESDREVSLFNERVPTIHIAVDGKVRHITPAFAARIRNESIVVHLLFPDTVSELIDPSLAECSSLSSYEIAGNAWALEHGVLLKMWTHELLHANQIRLENIKRLLRYVCTPLRFPSAVTKELIYTALRQSRTTTIDYLLCSLKAVDEDVVMTGLADMILGGTCYSDIDFFPLSYATELSVHHDFLKKNQ